MGIRLIRFLFITIFLFTCCQLFAQVVATDIEKEEPPKGLMEERIEQTISQAPFRAGAFWVVPKLNLFGAYDSNSFLVSTEVRDDFTFQGTPGVLAILPFRKRALLEVWDDLNFIYYRDLEDLRGVFNTVGGRFTIGGNRVLFSIADTYATRRAAVTQEFDFPTDEEINNFDSSITLAVAERSELRAFVGSYTSNITEDIVNPTGIPLSQFFDQKTFRVGGGFRRGVSSFTYFTADSFYEKWDFPEESQQPDADIFVAQGGFSFQAKGNIVGEAILGYKRMEPVDPLQAEFSGLIGKGTIHFRAGERTLIGFEYTRDVFPSVIANNWFFIENRVAPSIEFYVTRNFSVYATIGWEKNSYPRIGEVVLPTGEIVPGEVDDHAIDGTVSLRYTFSRIWQVFASANRLNRESNAPGSEKERNVYSFGIQMVF